MGGFIFVRKKIKMFELIFGIIWTAFSCFFAIMFFNVPANNYYVNGTEVSEAAFKAMLMPKLIIGLFIAVGIIMMIKGGRKVLKNMQTRTHGELCYGRVLAVERTGTYVNERPIFKAEIYLHSQLDGEDYTIWEEVGFNPQKYPTGSFVQVKYYKGDINFDETSAYTEDIPESMKQYLLSKTANLVFADNDESIVIDGVRYIKEEALDKYKGY